MRDTKRKKPNILGIHIPNKSERQCFIDGLKLMQKSIDPMHDITHVIRMVKMLMELERHGEFGNLSETEKKEILLSIVWHDVWRSQKLRQSYVLFLFDQMVEGSASAHMFVKYARKNKLSPQLIQNIKYAIRKHSSFQLTKRNTAVSKILYDLDTLERFSLQRLKKAEQFLVRNKLNTLLKKARYLAVLDTINMYFTPQKPNLFYHSWALRIFEQNRKNYLLYLKHQVSKSLGLPWIYAYFFPEN